MAYNTPKFICASLLTLAATVACGGTGTEDGTGGTAGLATGGTSSAMGTGGVATSSCDAAAMPFTVNAAVENNFTFSSTLKFDVQKVAPNNAELHFDWSTVTRSFLDQPLNSTTDFDMIALVLWDISPEEVAQKINESDPGIDLFAKVPVQFFPLNGETSANLLDFTVFGGLLTEEEILPYLDPNQTDPTTKTASFTLMPSKGTFISKGVQMIQAFEIDPASTNTTVTVTDTSAVLDSWNADLSNHTPTLMPAGQASIVVDWSTIATTGFGTTFTPTEITEVLIAHYDRTIPELEDQFLHIEEIAKPGELYRAPVPAGTSIDLSTLTNKETGATFPGVTSDGIWIVGLLCPDCINPTPWYISTIQTCQ